MTRAAVIDIGTNSVKLTVADLGDEIRVVKEESSITRLGRGVDSAGRLSSESIEKTLIAIQTFVKDAREAGAQSIVAAGTSALRDAANGEDLLSAVQSTCGLAIEIISGSREATLAFKAVAGDPSVVPVGTPNVVVFDIGGGSTELVWGEHGEVTDNVSLNIGAVRLTERHFHFDPPTEAEFAAASQDGTGLIRSFFADKPPSPALCGVGGTSSTFAAIVHSTLELQGKRVDVGALTECVDRLRQMTLSDRKKVPYLDPGRADIIVAGGAILLEILTELKASYYTVSLRGMRYGLLIEQKTTIKEDD